jgi:putative peptidoglycan lipid II flippase
VPKLTHLVVLLVLGAGTYFAALWLMGIRIKDFIHRASI